MASALAAYRYGFLKIALKNIDRLCLLTEKPCIFAFQAWRSYLIIVFRRARPPGDSTAAARASIPAAGHGRGPRLGGRPGYFTASILSRMPGAQDFASSDAR